MATSHVATHIVYALLVMDWIQVRKEEIQHGNTPDPEGHSSASAEKSHHDPFGLTRSQRQELSLGPCY